LLVEAATINESKQFIREYAPKIIQRADELADVVAYYVSTRGSKKGFPNSLKDGVAKAFSNFDEYQLNKYDSDKAAVSIGDVVKLVHPFGELPAAKAKALYNYLTKDEVDAENLPKIAALKALLGRDKLDEEALGLVKESGATWETVTSKFGSTKEVWDAVTPNMGYMALLRNLRNLIEKGANLDNVLEKIQNEKV
jgi:60 kDa SS-A/Ro ribonucleoprotein